MVMSLRDLFEPSTSGSSQSIDENCLRGRETITKNEERKAQAEAFDIIGKRFVTPEEALTHFPVNFNL